MKLIREIVLLSLLTSKLILAGDNNGNLSKEDFIKQTSLNVYKDGHDLIISWRSNGSNFDWIDVSFIAINSYRLDYKNEETCLTKHNLNEYKHVFPKFFEGLIENDEILNSIQNKIYLGYSAYLNKPTSKSLDFLEDFKISINNSLEKIDEQKDNFLKTYMRPILSKDDFIKEQHLNIYQDGHDLVVSYIYSSYLKRDKVSENVEYFLTKNKININLENMPQSSGGYYQTRFSGFFAFDETKSINFQELKEHMFNQSYLDYLEHKVSKHEKICGLCNRQMLKAFDFVIGLPGKQSFLCLTCAKKSVLKLDPSKGWKYRNEVDRFSNYFESYGKEVAEDLGSVYESIGNKLAFYKKGKRKFRKDLVITIKKFNNFEYPIDDLIKTIKNNNKCFWDNDNSEVKIENDEQENTKIIFTNYLYDSRFDQLEDLRAIIKSKYFIKYLQFLNNK